MARHGENIHKRKDGRWEARYAKGMDPQGKKLTGYVYGHSYMEVKSKRAGILKNLRLTKIDSRNPTVEEVGRLWLNSIRYGVKESTLAHYRYTLEHYLLSVLGGCRVQALNESKLDAALLEILDPRNQAHKALGAMQSHECVALLNRIFKYGCLHHLMAPLEASIKLPPVQPPKEEPLNESERRNMQTFVLAHPKPRTVGLLLTLVMGLRIGEVCGLRWEDFDFARGILSVQRTVSRIRVEQGKTAISVRTPKTSQSCREIPIPDALLPLLQKLRGDLPDNAWFLSGKMDKPVEPRNYLKSFKGYLEKCGVRDIRFHLLRHTFATTCLQSGCDIKTLSEIMGHANPSVTLKRYVHTSMEKKRADLGSLYRQELAACSAGLIVSQGSSR